MSALEARGVSFAYDAGPRAIEDVDLEIRAGELLCVLGPNGAGKSTLLKILGGLLEPQRGRVTLDGRALRELGARGRARAIAWVPQTLSALPETTVERFVRGARYAHELRLGGGDPGGAKAVERALAAADASELATRMLTELSGGQQRRVLVARALAQEARVLLFDEPTASLDPEHQVQIFRLAGRLVEMGSAVVVATHELNLSSRYAARVVLLGAGRIVASGPPESVLVPTVLRPLYGGDLLFASAAGARARPLVIAWPREDGVAGACP